MENYPRMKEMPLNPDYVFFKIVSSETYFLDNTAGFGNQEHLFLEERSVLEHIVPGPGIEMSLLIS
jgi:hypothetical protein